MLCHKQTWRWICKRNVFLSSVIRVFSMLRSDKKWNDHHCFRQFYEKLSATRFKKWAPYKHPFNEPNPYVCHGPQYFTLIETLFTYIIPGTYSACVITCGKHLIKWSWIYSIYLLVNKRHPYIHFVVVMLSTNDACRKMQKRELRNLCIYGSYAVHRNWPYHNGFSCNMYLWTGQVLIPVMVWCPNNNQLMN